MLNVPLSWLQFSDERLGAAVRALIAEEAESKKANIQQGWQSARRKLGQPVIIDGKAFDSRTQARKSLGMTFAAFTKKYPNVHSE